MQLSVRFLGDVQNVNSFEHVSALEITGGDAQTLYFQLIDASVDREDQGYMPAGRRYMPPATTTLQVTMLNIDDAKKVVRFATQPFSDDRSIWSIPVLASDPMRGTVSLKFLLTEPTRVLNANFVPGIVFRIS